MSFKLLTIPSTLDVKTRRLTECIFGFFSDSIVKNESVVTTAKHTASLLVEKGVSAEALENSVFPLLEAENIMELTQQDESYLDAFKFYLQSYLTNPDELKKTVEYMGLNRVAAPSRGAYILTGNNKMDIKETKKGYAIPLDI